MYLMLPLMLLLSPVDTSKQKNFIKPVHIIAKGDLKIAKKVPANPKPSDDVTYGELLEQAVYNCNKAKPGKVDKTLIKKLFQVEEKYKIPIELRGLLVAAACSESGYNPNAKGDRKFSKKRTPKAIGMFQMWSWWEKRYKIDRRKPLDAAEAYMKHITKQLKTVDKKCKYRKKQTKKRWLSAWATAIRYPKKSGRCGEKPAYYRLLKKWHKDIRLIRKENDKATECGC
jgi:hypothetical protein